ncbi:MAG: D-2-hydroxyacid dehydrogenase family protein, partial [Burkholderiales bacterium]
MTRIAVLDDWQAVARDSADWSALSKKAEVVFFDRAFDGPEQAARALAGFEILIAMRERTAFPKALIERLPKLKLIALTGSRTWTMDLDACSARGIVVCNT